MDQTEKETEREEEKEQMTHFDNDGHIDDQREDQDQRSKVRVYADSRHEFHLYLPFFTS